MEKKLKSWQGWLLFGGTMVVVFVLGMIAASVNERHAEVTSVMNNKKTEITGIEARNDKFESNYPREYQTWEATADTSFKSLYNGNQAVDVLEARPEMVILWAGYAFSKDYSTPRGHMHAIEDMRNTLRVGAPMTENEGPQPATCWTCKSPDVPRMMQAMGVDNFYKGKWASLGKEIVNPIGCADCHEPENMNLHISRPALIEAFQRQGKDITKATQQEMRSLIRDTTTMGRDIRNYQTMLNTNMGEQDKLNALLQQKMSELDERERTINELQDMMNAQNAKVQNLLSSVKDALLGFNSDELTVTEKNGKVYVAMSDKLLFQSGSAKVDKRGKEALAKLAEVLNKQNDIDVYIEGHTDSKPINTAQFKDNWDLSVIRATSVVRILTKDYGVNPLQIQPCGRGEFMPVADNETADGRSKNRRTEIIMAPKLDKLMQMLQ